MVNSIPMITLLCLLVSFWTCHGAAALFIGDTLNPGEALNSSSSMVSASGEFTLGFNSGYLILRCKNYAVWVANLHTPISDPSSALLTLEKNTTVLQITLKGKNPIVLYSPFHDNSTNNVVATLLDSGNLVLREVNQNVSNSPLWQSFDGPNVALRPGMKLGFDAGLSITSNSMSIWSWQENQNSPGPGSFSLYWDSGTRQLQVRRNGDLWWTSETLKSGIYEYANFRNKSKVYNFSVVSYENGDFFSYTVVGDPNGRSAWVLDTGGELYDVNYNISIGSAGDCDGYNYHTTYSYVAIDGYNPVAGKCQRWSGRATLYCPVATSSGAFIQPTERRSFRPISMNMYINSTWEETNSSRYGIYECMATCWMDCDCLGFEFLFDNQTGCRFWSVKYSQVLEDPDSSATKYIIPGLVATNKPQSRRNIIGENQINIQDMLNVMKSNRPTDANGLQNDGKRGQDLSVFSYASIIAATCNFSNENKLGEGGFGPVYKGKLVTGQEVAVKRLSKRSGQGLYEFKNELILIYELQHTNLVQLFGFCIHGEERMLIYEYMPNRSLDYFLFDSTRCQQQLDWNNRFSIIEGIAQGLLYLHKYSRMKVIHRDLKASNVLLDESMNPKISDFGMARIFTNDEQEANTMKIVGTRGYMSPEYIMGGKFSIKSDVYSFGVLMLEILSGRRNNSFYNDDRALNLVGYAWAIWKEGAGLELMDPTLGDSCDKDHLLRCIHVGLLCVEENAASRPKVLDVISMLTNESMSLPVPTKPAFCTERNVITTTIGGNGPEVVVSVNGISNSDFDGR
ncbi:putative protein kinase RLK-Pelle-DLSV family [Rosa chinensis]|uniref:Receptor-like serine/threonine-protein kinase n=1 Tax=Rosa chinensis TaxID=74649 RepID=A0A2P6Q8K9_ROSCH|nr:putative protein kinase RLK-Pelle-DLSV family [Rosa chinensis]